MASSENNEILHPRENNKTNRERREKEAQQTKALKTVGFILGGLVVVLVILGIIFGSKEKNAFVATVGDEKISVKEYQQAVSYQRSQAIQNYEYYKQMYQMFGIEMDESTKESYRSQLSEDYKALFGIQVLSNLVDQRVAAYGAEKEGISVDEDEVESRYQGMFGYYPNGTPTAGPTDIPFEATPTVSQEQLDILRYTPTPSPEEETEATVDETAVEEVVEEPVAEEVIEEPVVEEALVEEVVEEPVAEEALVEEVIEEPVAEEVAVEEVVEEPVIEEVAVEETTEEVAEATEEVAEEEPTVVPTEYTEKMFNTYEDYYFANNYQYSKDFFKGQLRAELLSEKIREKLGVDVPREADMVWARHILVETEDEAKAVIERLAAGEEWGDVAAEVSTDESNAANGGDLGWFDETRMVAPFTEAAFSQEVGTISEAPVATDFGFHVIQVIAHENHPYTSSEFDEAVSKKYQEWLDKYSEELGVELEENLGKYTPVDPAFPD